MFDNQHFKCFGSLLLAVVACIVVTCGRPCQAAQWEAYSDAYVGTIEPQDPVVPLKSDLEFSVDAYDCDACMEDGLVVDDNIEGDDFDYVWSGNTDGTTDGSSVMAKTDSAGDSFSVSISVQDKGTMGDNSQDLSSPETDSTGFTVVEVTSISYSGGPIKKGTTLEKSAFTIVTNPPGYEGYDIVKVSPLTFNTAGDPITVTASCGDYSSVTCTVVVVHVEITGVTKTTIEYNESTTISATVTPAGRTLNWSVSGGTGVGISPTGDPAAIGPSVTVTADRFTGSGSFDATVYDAALAACEASQEVTVKGFLRHTCDAEDNRKVVFKDPHAFGSAQSQSETFNLSYTASHVGDPDDQCNGRWKNDYILKCSGAYGILTEDTNSFLPGGGCLLGVVYKVEVAGTTELEEGAAADSRSSSGPATISVGGVTIGCDYGYTAAASISLASDITASVDESSPEGSDLSKDFNAVVSSSYQFAHGLAIYSATSQPSGELAWDDSIVCEGHFEPNP